MKKIYLMFIFTFLILSSINLVSSFGPSTHNALANSIFLSNDTEVAKLCSETDVNQAAYRLGAETPDLTVIYYYDNGGSEYRLSHNWNFQQEIMAQALTDDEKCFGYGIASHLLADSISHNHAVPTGIENTKVPNWLSHPLLEQKYDAYLIYKHPELANSTSHMMDALFGPKGDRYAQMVQNAMGTNTKIDAKSELVKLSYALGTFYNGQFKPQGQSWIFKTYPYIQEITILLSPIIGSTNSVNMDDYYTQSQEQITNIFNNWGARYEISPHGFDSLSKANDDVGYWFYIILSGLFIAPIALAVWKRKWRWLLLIPALLIIMVLVVYAML